LTTFVESTVRFPYKRSLGPVIGQYMTALTERRLLGIRAGDRVISPPLEWDPETGEQLAPDLVEVGPAGTVRSWTWVGQPGSQHPLDRPFAFALIELDGATTALVHAVDAGAPEAMATGMRVAPRWRAVRTGHPTDIEAFVPGEEPVTPENDAGPAAEPVTMLNYSASITYTTPVPGNQERAAQAIARGVLLGFQCPTCGRTYSGMAGSCAIDGLLLGPEHDVELPQTGVITNYTIITPVQYPGQTETEPFARVQVLLDGIAVVLAYQPVVGLPNADIHTGVRVAAQWSEGAGGRKVLDGWRPTGEPDNDDPTLVNRIM
jgi:uncharacterized OB-fold protein